MKTAASAAQTNGRILPAHSDANERDACRSERHRNRANSNVSVVNMKFQGEPFFAFINHDIEGAGLDRHGWSYLFNDKRGMGSEHS
jgi:hypothetical protein